MALQALAESGQDSDLPVSDCGVESCEWNVHGYKTWDSLVWDSAGTLWSLDDHE